MFLIPSQKISLHSSSLRPQIGGHSVKSSNITLLSLCTAAYNNADGAVLGKVLGRNDGVALMLGFDDALGEEEGIPLTLGFDDVLGEVDGTLLTLGSDDVLGEIDGKLLLSLG